MEQRELRLMKLGGGYFPVTWRRLTLQKPPKSWYQLVLARSKLIPPFNYNSLNFYLLSSVAGGAVSRVDPDSTDLNPSWRKALSEVYIIAAWPEGSTADFIFQQIDEMKQRTLILDELTTDSGAYLNEVTNHTT